MPFLHAKTSTCPNCKATVFCSSEQVDKGIVCPQCGVRFTPPGATPTPPPLPNQTENGAQRPPPIPPSAPRPKPVFDDQPPPDRHKEKKGKGCLLFGCLGCLGVLLADEADIKRAATLQDGGKRLHGAVSFGPRTWPQGTQPETDIAPGGTCTDILMFECDGEPPNGDFLLSLPGENLGRSGGLRFLIPREMVR